MAILQTATTSFKVELPQGIHNFGPTSPDTFKIALYTAAADLGYATAAYTTSGEVVGTGYTAGGNTLTITVTPVAANNLAGTPTAYFSFANTSWTGATFTDLQQHRGQQVRGCARFRRRQDREQRHLPSHFPNCRCQQRYRAYFIRTHHGKQQSFRQRYSRPDHATRRH
jgi:hypothetical protein